jgi:hypothetical protein
MELSRSEQKAFERLKRERSSWRVMRYIFIALGIATIAVAGYSHLDTLKQLSNIGSGARDMPESTTVLAALATQNLVLHYILMWVGAGFIAWGVIRWNGNPTVNLVLKLLEDRLSQRVSLGESRGNTESEWPPSNSG